MLLPSIRAALPAGKQDESSVRSVIGIVVILAGAPARCHAHQFVLWQRLGFAGQYCVYPTVCHQYRVSMNEIAEWAKARGRTDHAGA